MSEFHHVSVLLNEAVEGLNVRPDGIYLDGTWAARATPPRSPNASEPAP